MLQSYLNASIKKAEYKQLETGDWFAEFPGLDGVWANGASVELCRQELLEVLEEWLILKIHDGDPIPSIDGIKIVVKREEVA